MLERIKLILEEKGLQLSSFADKIQVSRGTVSHIFNGRNNPSKYTVDKILYTFPDISSSWLLNGEGTMYKRNNAIIRENSSLPPEQLDLFNENSTVELTGRPNANKYSQKNEVKKPEIINNQTNTKDINLSNNISKKIDKIIIFFSDKTFMTFISEE